jgi:hypothetical protein
VTGKAPEGSPEYIKEAEALIDYINLSEEEKMVFDMMEKAQADYDAEMSTARHEAWDDSKYDDARNALAEGLSPEVIHRITGLDTAKIRQISATMSV